PIYANQLMPLHDYKLLKGDQLLRRKLMKESASINIEQANTLFQKVASSFVESVIVINDFWYMITSFSVFIHDQVHTDDCADNS
ncbi:hypothetical protein HMPREF1544_00621, partial [Mucor circinelloides 1006PhL]